MPFADAITQSRNCDHAICLRDLRSLPVPLYFLHIAAETQHQLQPYLKASLPLYILVDGHNQTVHLFSSGFGILQLLPPSILEDRQLKIVF